MVIKVVLAHPHPSTRAVLAGAVGGQRDIEVVGECGDGRRAWELVGRLAPTVLVTGVRLPGLNGVELTRRIVARGGPHGPRVVVLADGAPPALALEALRAGARGLIFHTGDTSGTSDTSDTKDTRDTRDTDTDTGELPRALRLVADGGAVVSPRLTRPLIDACLRGPGPADPPPALDRLTARERQVLSLVGTGLSTQEIADRLVVAEVTAKTHVRRTMVKLGARSRTQLVAIAYESGMLRPRVRT